MKILTVAVPVYNTEKYIKRCLESVLIDEISDILEVVAVNDGSRDGSLSILNEYKEKYPETLVVIDKENGGHGSAVNAGLKAATGKYFRVLDSDDWVDTASFVRMVKKLENETCDVVITDYSKEFVYNGATEKITWKELEPDRTYVFDDTDLSVLCGEYFVMANSVYKTETLRRSGLSLIEKTFYVDMQYNIVPVPEIETFKYYDLDIYRYFIGRPDQSMNLGNFVKNRAHHEKVVKYLLDFYNEKAPGLSKKRREYIELIMYYMLNTHYYIYCVYPEKGSKEFKREIKAFDKYLKEINPALYARMNNIGQIRYNRKTGFAFVGINPKFFSKAVSKAGRVLKRSH